MEEPGDGLHEEQRIWQGIDIFGVWGWMDGSWLYRIYILLLLIIIKFELVSLTVRELRTRPRDK